MKENNEIKELVVIEQLPIIKQQLQIISEEIDKEIKYALSLECDEDSKKEVKNARSRLNKIKTSFEYKRKEVKNAIMNPYNEFENIYNELVKDKLNNADSILKERIDEIELLQLDEKKLEIEEFANEHIINKNLQDLISYEQLNINITLSASIKSLKDLILSKLEKIEDDIKLIELEDYKDEILIEYKNSYNFANAKIIVINRHKTLEEMKRKEEEYQNIKKEEEKVIEKVDEVTPPKEIDEDLITIQFTITDTIDRIKEVKRFLIEGGYKYE